MIMQALTPSMANEYLTCPQRFYYNYVERLSRLPKWYLSFGLSFHETLRENYWQKIATHEDLPVDFLCDFFRDDLEYSETDWTDQDKSQAKDMGIISLRAYQQEIAVKTQPIHAEYTFRWSIQNRPWLIEGKIDVINDIGIVIDTKTTGRKNSKPKREHSFQAACYASAFKRQAPDWGSNSARIDYSVRGSSDLISYPILFDGNTESAVLNVFDQVARGIDAEIWTVNPYSILCSRKYCDYWDQCEKDNIWRVPE